MCSLIMCSMHYQCLGVDPQTEAERLKKIYPQMYVQSLPHITILLHMITLLAERQLNSLRLPCIN